MRLLDRIIRDGFQVTGLTVDKTEWSKSLAQSQLVVADNVAEYYLRSHTEGAPITASDFPNVMLPFEFTFLEMRYPAFSELKQNGYEEGGVFLVMDEIKQFERLGGLDSKEKQTIFHQPGVEYCLRGYLFLQLRGREPRLFGYFALPVDSQGRVVSSSGKVELCVHAPIDTSLVDAEGREQFTNGILIQRLALPTLLALSFMHCRNIKMVEEIPPPKLSKKHEKRGGKPLCRYHVLKIDHMKLVLEREGHASTEGLKKALHICRGHFATYGKDGKGKLFGKHEGRYWIPMHMRGNPEHGVVDKMYDVH